MQDKQSVSSPVTCRCGHDRAHPQVEARPVHGFWGWLKLLNGISTLPKRVEYRCRKCGTVLGATRDEHVRYQFR